MKKPPIPKIEKRLKDATPGPWRVSPKDNMGVWAKKDGEEMPIFIADVYADKPNDFIFVANAPTDIADLLAYVKHLEGALRQYGEHKAPCHWTQVDLLKRPCKCGWQQTEEALDANR